jgi:RNA polymerase sigma-70 factor (ECF subfamily)
MTTATVPLESSALDEAPPSSRGSDDLPPPDSESERTLARSTFLVERRAPTLNATGLGESQRDARRREAEEDRALVGRAQAGDKQAFRQLVERHQRRALGLANALVRNESDARELVQEAFLRAYKNLGSFQGGSAFYTWLYRIVSNLAVDHLRKPGRRESEYLDERALAQSPGGLASLPRMEGADPMEALHRRELASRLQEALEALPPYHRGVILMREVEGMSYEEMAEAMGVSKGTIMSRLFHARQKLQKALSGCYAEVRAEEDPA